MVQGLMFIPNAEFFNVNNTPNLPSPYLMVHSVVRNVYVRFPK